MRSVKNKKINHDLITAKAGWCIRKENTVLFSVLLNMFAIFCKSVFKINVENDEADNIGEAKYFRYKES